MGKDVVEVLRVIARVECDHNYCDDHHDPINHVCWKAAEELVKLRKIVEDLKVMINKSDIISVTEILSVIETK